MERKWKQKRTKKVRQLTDRTRARLTVNIILFKVSKYVIGDSNNAQILLDNQ